MRKKSHIVAQKYIKDSVETPKIINLNDLDEVIEEAILEFDTMYLTILRIGLKFKNKMKKCRNPC